MRLYLFVMLLCAFSWQCASSRCEDYIRNCLNLARIGECKRNSPFMKSHCCKSCKAVEAGPNQNIALHQPTRQSSTAWGGYSSRAVDGNSNPAYDGKSCTHTGHDSHAWWNVDLGCATKVSVVRITNRVNSWQRLANFDVRLGMAPNTPTGSKVCKSYHGTITKGATVDIKCDKATVGRYLYVMLRGKEYLTLCEVQVFREFPKRVNLALHRPAKQSSTHYDNDASRAVDGSKQNAYGEKSCAVTQKQKNAWWRVDLGKSFDIGLIRISNRRDGWELSNFKVLVGDVEGEPSSNSLCTYYYGKVPPGAVFELSCQKKTKGRYVFITKHADFHLSICEVEIYSDVPKDYHGNLALYKPTMQSSTYKSHYGTYATDGILHGSELCAWTNSEENSWWAVDLGAPKVVKMVRLSNPASSWHGLVDFDIRVNNRCGNPINSQLCMAYFGKMALSSTRDFKCKMRVNGQYVYVLSRQKRHLGICEVEVYSTEKAPGVKRNVICEQQ